MDALKYLVKIGPEYTNEWTEAAMYTILCNVINSDEEIFTTKKKNRNCLTQR